MGSLQVLQFGSCLLGVTLVVLAFKGVETAVINKDTRNLERFFIGRVVSPFCFHDLAFCKIGCRSCDKCYQEYVECGLASYKTTTTTTTTTTTASTVNLGVGTTSEADSLSDGAEKVATQDTNKNRVRIPIVSDPTSWKGILVSKIRLAINEATAATTTTTTESPSEHISDAPPGGLVGTTGSDCHSTLDSKEYRGSTSVPGDSHRNTTDSTKRTNQHRPHKHRKHHHHHRHNHTDSDTKNLVNDTGSAGNDTITVTKPGVNPPGPLPPHNTTESVKSDIPTHSDSTEATTTNFNDYEGPWDETSAEDSTNLDVSTIAEISENITESPTRPYPPKNSTSEKPKRPREYHPQQPNANHPLSSHNTTKPSHSHGKHAHSNDSSDHAHRNLHGNSTVSTTKPTKDTWTRTEVNDTLLPHHTDATASTTTPLNNGSTTKTEDDHTTLPQQGDSIAAPASPPKSTHHPEHGTHHHHKHHEDGPASKGKGPLHR